MSEKQRVVYVVSDSVGETAELVVKAASSQFNGGEIEIRRIPYVNDADTVIETVQAAKEEKALIAFTLVVPELQELLITEAGRKQVPYVDIMGPMIQGMSELFQHEPKYKPGLIHQLDEDYFRKVEAIEFAVKYDDGKDPNGILKADIVLIGVSRTSKTPLSQYLALKRYKVANVPVVPEVKPPEELFKIDPRRCIGLKISPEKLVNIRKERLIALGLDDSAHYAKMERIRDELAFFDELAKTNKAVEETANIIINHMYKLSL